MMLDVRPRDFSDAGNAEKFAAAAKHGALWCDSLGWLYWDGMRWDQNKHKVTAAAIEFAQAMLEDATELYKSSIKTEDGKVSVPDKVKRYLKHAERTRNRIGIEGFLELSKAYLHISASELDCRWWEFNTKAGIVDLRTGAIRPHDPAALHTKLAPFCPSTVGAEEWQNFLNLVHSGDTELIRYKQARVGMQAFGKVLTEDLEIDIGGGKNGKSTLNNAIFKVFGDYAGAIDSFVLTTDRQQKGAALATLRGKRFVVCGELEEGQRLSIATLKRIASTDPLTIEAKYRDPESVMPSHHVILYSNFLPKVGSNDAGTWRRLTVIPYKAEMPSGEKLVLNYADELVERCGGAILRWILDGARMFCESGFRLEQPLTVRNAVQEYRSAEDWLANFIADRCLLDNPSAKIKASELYAEYHSYAVQNGEYPRRNNDFARAMESAGYRRVNIHNRPHYVGIRIDYAQNYGEPPPVSRYS